MADVLVLEADRARVAVDVERGGRLASVVIDGRELLVGPSGPEDRSIRWGSFLMAPWPGRLANGGLRWAGETVQLPRNHGRHAIHGQVFDRPWRVDRMGPRSCDLSIALDRARWPFGGLVRQRISLARGRLDLAAEVMAEEPMPAGLGWHPWFRRVLGGTPVRSGDLRVRLRAEGILERRGILPTGRVLEVRGAADLGTGPVLGRRRLDDAFVGVVDPPVIEWPGLRLTLRLAPRLSTVVVYTSPGAFCVEPQTAWPNALGLPAVEAELAGADIVEPGRPLVAAWSMRWSRRGD